MQKQNKTNVTHDDAATLALRALAYVVSDANLGPRWLALTGLMPADLRARASDPAVLAATLAFLEGHQPSLIACAGALGVPPETLIAAREALGA